MRVQKTLSALLLIAIANNSTAAMSHGITPDALPVISAVVGTSETLNPQTPGKMEVTTMPNTLQTSTTNAPLVEKFLLEGKLADGRRALEEHLREHPADDQARFGLGVLIFLDAVAHLKQSLFHYGLRSHSEISADLPFTRLQVAVNPAPALFSYQDARKLVEDFQKGLLDADRNLALIKSPDVKLPLHFGMIKLNFKDEKHPDGGESLWTVYSRLTNNQNIEEETAKAFYIKFDRGDVHWLRGYCNLLSACCDMYLAYDSKALFEHTAHIFFKKVDSPYKFLTGGKRVHGIGREDLDVVDAIAFIHLINFRISKPEKMHDALHHLEMVVAQSRESWKFIMAETGDDHEWLPNPRQTGVIPGMQVTDEMVTSWAKIMDQSEKLLKGKELIPFWRGTHDSGVNLRKVFLEPGDFDLVLWVQGTDAMPYLETGTLSDGDIWRQARSTFGNRFPGFALYFN
jgi:hypothetical protein